MQFNESQLRLWHSMIESIEDFRKGKLQYFDLLNELEGRLDAGEFKNKNLVEQWYDFWTPLEAIRAHKGNNVTIVEVNKYLSNMEAFLKSRFDE